MRNGGLSYWSALLTNGKLRSELEIIPTLTNGVAGTRKLDWTLDLASTGDTDRIKELTLHCPNGQEATLEIVEPGTAFHFVTKSVDAFGSNSAGREAQIIGRVIDKASGACECWIWDYRPFAGQKQLIAYQSTIQQFGAWRQNLMPIGALAIDVQGFRL
jgi:hypothetical protein